MTKHQITENTPVVIRMTIIVGSVLGLCIWFNTRLTAVEMVQIEQKSDIRYVREVVDEIKTDVKDLKGKP